MLRRTFIASIPFAFAGASAASSESAGLTGAVGAPAGSKTVKILRIQEAGLYENIIVDGEWGGQWRMTVSVLQDLEEVSS